MLSKFHKIWQNIVQNEIKISDSTKHCTIFEKIVKNVVK